MVSGARDGAGCELDICKLPPRQGLRVHLPSYSMKQLIKSLTPGGPVSTEPLIFILPPLAFASVGCCVMLALATTALRPEDLSAELRSARRHAVLSAALATAVLLAATAAVWVYAVTSTDIDGNRGLAVAPLLGVIAALAVLLVGEVTWPRPRGRVRSAPIRQSGLRGMWVPAWVALGTGSAVALVAFLVWLMPQADSSGRRYSVGGPRTPDPAFPGWFYAAPQLVALGVAVVLVLVLARAAWLRPAVMSADPAADMRLRRASTSRAMRLIAAGSLLVAAGDFYIAGNAFSASGRGFPPPTVADILAALCALGAVATLLIPVAGLKSEDVAAPPRMGTDRDVVDHR